MRNSKRNRNVLTKSIVPRISGLEPHLHLQKQCGVMETKVVLESLKHMRSSVPFTPPLMSGKSKLIPKSKGRNVFSLRHVRAAKEDVLKRFAIAPKTIKGRASAMRSWKEYCKNERYSSIPNENTLGDYIMHEVMRGRVVTGVLTSLSSIGNSLIDEGRLSQERWTRIIQSRAIIRLKVSLKNRDAAIGVHVKKAKAITEAELRILCNEARSYDEKVLAAVAITGFYNLHRGGELVASVAGEEKLKLPFAQSVKVTDESIQYTIRSEKMGQYEKTSSILHRNSVPNWAMLKWKQFWCQRKSLGFASHPDIFVLQSGTVASGRDLSKFLSKYKRFSTHSLRSGGATHMLKNGHTLLQIQVKGRWKGPSALMGYLRRYPEVGRLLRACATVNGICSDAVLEEF